ncbi:MAG: hypothetical protein KAY11_21035, partial [Ilumatobacteraceae bacterium]|nr:hypothetical protein [Ilumatobacteraceae bacterium]
MTGPHTDRSKIAQRFETDVVEPMDDFDDPSQEWRRLFSEALGTFFLVLVAAGGGMMDGPSRHHRPQRRCRRTRDYGDGDHLVHGQGLWLAPEPRGEHRIRA